MFLLYTRVPFVDVAKTLAEVNPAHRQAQIYSVPQHSYDSTTATDTQYPIASLRPVVKCYQYEKASPGAPPKAPQSDSHPHFRKDEGDYPRII